MKILITHNDYGRHSGEESAVDKMGDMMRTHGHDICYYRTSTAGHQHGLRSRIRIFFSGIYSWRGVNGIKRTLSRENPDIINVHNLYPFISPAALFACKSKGIPIVMTVHNYRLVCPTGLFLRDDRPCEHCLHHGNEWGCIRFNCEKNFFKSTAYALRSFIARKFGAYRKNVDRYVCLTYFQKKKLIEAGFRADKITVIPNSIKLRTEHGSSSGQYIAYVGRLSKEKGWDLLVEIAKKNPGLIIAVAGSLREEHETITLPDNIRFSGFLDQDKLTDFYRKARFLVIPSRCYEGFPLVALEAMAMGKPIIAPDHGGFSDIVGKNKDATGILFRPNDPDDLEHAILRLWNDPDLTRTLGTHAIEKIRTSYSSELVYRQWEDLFTELLQSRKN